MHASARRSQTRPCWCTRHSTVHVRCATGHPGGSSVRAPTVRTLTAWWRGCRTGHVQCAPDCPVHHSTDSFHQMASLVVGAINTPNHPTFKSSKFSTSQPLTRARHSILDTLKVIKSSPIPHKTLVIRERDLSCSFELLRLDCFFSFSLVLVIKAHL
jgi:hypothetical protein